MRATVLVPETVATFRGARVRLLIERIRYADAKAEIVAEHHADHIGHQEGQETQIPFDLDVASLSDVKSLNLRAHVDLDGDGTVNAGDLLSQQSYRLSNVQDAITVFVEKLGS